MSTKLMQRIFSAYKNQEDAVLNQVQNDIEIAKEDGRLETEQYSIIADDEGIDIYDKINNEVTHIDEKDDVYHMSVPTHVPELPLGTPVIWMDDSGIMQEGTLEAINGDIATVSINGAPNAVKYDLLKPVDESSKDFADVFKDKFIFRLGDYDLEYDIKKKVVKVLDDNVKAEWQVNPSKSFDDFLKSTAEKLKTLKDEHSKNYPDNLKKFSATAQKFFTKDTYKFRCIYLDNSNPKFPKIIDKIIDTKETTSYLAEKVMESIVSKLGNELPKLSMNRWRFKVLDELKDKEDSIKKYIEKLNDKIDEIKYSNKFSKFSVVTQKYFAKEEVAKGKKSLAQNKFKKFSSATQAYLNKRKSS